MSNYVGYPIYLQLYDLCTEFYHLLFQINGSKIKYILKEL